MDTEWKTSDLYMAAFFLSKDIQFEGIDRDGSKVFFIFRDSPERENLVRGYLNNNVTVFPRTYRDCIQALKDMIFQGG